MEKSRRFQTEINNKIKEVKQAASDMYIEKVKNLSLESMHNMPHLSMNMPVTIYCGFFDDYFRLEENMTFKQAQTFSKAMNNLYNRYEKAFPRFAEGMKEKKMKGYYRLKG